MLFHGANDTFVLGALDFKAVCAVLKYNPMTKHTTVRTDLQRKIPMKHHQRRWFAIDRLRHIGHGFVLYHSTQTESLVEK